MSSSSSPSLQETMRRRRPILLTFLSIFLFASSSLYLSRHADHHFHSLRSVAVPTSGSIRNSAIREPDLLRHSRRVSSVNDYNSDLTVSVLFPAWEVLVITSLEINSDDRYFCHFQNNISSQARFAGVLPSTNRTTFKCDIPKTFRRRRRHNFLQPVLTRVPEKEVYDDAAAQELMRWKFLAYDSLTTRNDVVVFVKGVNHRSGINRPPSDFNCVFWDSSAAVRTAVTSSVQEVFRCPHPKFTASSSGEPIKVSLEIKHESNDQNVVVPSVAYYTPTRRIEDEAPKSLMCASTMVYNVAKFLHEWVMYHSSIGVQRFILYDNGSDDDLRRVVAELNRRGYNVEVVNWIWPKTQEAGFSHSAIYAKPSCEWMVYIDVDEFVYAPSWANSSQPSPDMLESLLPDELTRTDEAQIGQVSIRCNEFGPSGQKAHPEEGVTQGYDCRRRMEQRHKSVVLLEAVDPSLMNVIHHFRLKERFATKMMGMGKAVVNHYKYQAWTEFKNKFRRRVSAYVVDWTETGNLKSKDRTPGLGFAPVEPEGWSEKFCEVRDDRLKALCQRWFGDTMPFGYKMAWQ